MGNKTTTKAKYVQVTQYTNLYTYPIRNTYSIMCGEVYNRVGTNLPNYRSVISAGGDANTPLTVTIDSKQVYPDPIRVKTPNGKVSHEDGYAMINHITGSSAYYLDLSSREAQVTAKATAQLMSKIKSTRQSYSGMEFLGELRETVHQMRHPAEAAFKLATAFQTYKRRALKHNALSRKLKRLPIGSRGRESLQREVRRLGDLMGNHKPNTREAIGGTILEYTYGLAPLVKELAGISSSVFTGLQETQRVLSGFSGTNDAGVILVESGFSTTEGFKNPKLRLNTSTVLGVRVRAKYRHSPKTSALPAIVSLSNTDWLTDITKNVQHVISRGGFRKSEIVPTMWELFPLSVIVDYFVNVSDVLEASFWSTEGVSWSSTTVNYQKFLRGTLSMTPQSGWSFLSEGVPTFDSQQRKYVRKATSFAIPALEFSLPGSPIQWLNLGALTLTQI